MKSYEELINQVKDLIRKNKTNKALELLAKEQLSTLDQQLILINSRYSKLKEEQTLGILDDDTAQRTLNKINVELLALADKIGKHQNSPQAEKLAIEVEEAISKESTHAPTKEIKKQPASSASSKPAKKGNTKIISGVIGVILLALIGYFGMQQVNKNAEIKEKEKIQMAKDQKEKERIDSEAKAKQLEEEKQKKEDAERIKKIAVGKRFEGGIIYYVDDTKLHGLIMSLGDQSPNPINWFGETKGKAQAFDTGVYRGSKNTERLVKKFPEKDHPAQLCDRYEYDGFDDWYLPSQVELNKLYEFNKTLPKAQKLAQEYYWSSTEFSSKDVYYKSFYNGRSYNLIKGNKAMVRAIRKF